MTESTSHIKGITENLAETFHRKKIPSQISCDSQTTLVSDKGIAKTIHTIEN